MARRFRPTLWPSLITFPAILILLGLGTWQLQRLEEKTAQIAARAAALAAPVIPLPEGDFAAFEYRHVAVEGLFDHGHEFYRVAFDDFGNTGFEVVTPLRLDRGGILLVDRGFVPEARKAPATRAEGQIDGKVRVEGVLRLPHPASHSWFVPESKPGDGFWFAVDPAGMAAASGLVGVLPVYVEAGPEPNPGGLPIGGRSRLDIPNNHLQYAITWYVFAFSLLVIYFLYHFRETAEP
jgi:surfeit locus 1 family protein